MLEPKDYIAIVTACLGLIGLGFGLYQYYVAQKWKRSEFAARHLEQLMDDAHLSLLCKLLDWDKRTLPVPEYYRSLAGTEVFEHNWTVFTEAMLPDRRTGECTWHHDMYRDLMDRFCEYLKALNHYVSIGLMDLGDIATIDYWVRHLEEARYAGPKEKDMFLRFIQAFGDRGVTDLMGRFRARRRILTRHPGR